MEEAGAEVLVFSADVANQEQMRNVVRQVKERFGTIHGVIHSAGVPGDGVIELKTREIADEVLAPKVRGTLILEELLRNEPLDFFVLCSSLTAFFGAAGQVDYTAANAFLDAFAHSRRTGGGVSTISINWDRWNETGMAVDALLGVNARGEGDPSPDGFGPQGDAPGSADAEVTTDRSNSEEVSHPVFVGHSKQGDTDTFWGYLSGEHWIVGEHKLMGVPTLVGTAYLELVRAAFERLSGSAQSELQDVVFLTPLMVQDGDRREIAVILKPSGQLVEFRVRSRSGKSGWQDHAAGKVGLLQAPFKAESYDIPALLDGIGVNGQNGDESHRVELTSGPIQAGPRWEIQLSSLTEMPNGGFAVLTLPEQFRSDLDDFKLHPALMDCATMFVSLWMPRTGTYLPYTYSRVKIRRPNVAKLCCVARYAPMTGPEDEILNIDLDVFDEHGDLLMEINGYGLKRVPDALLKQWDDGRSSNVAPSALARDKDRLPKPGEWGIQSKEGAEVFRRILSFESIPQVAIASVDLNWLLRELGSVADEGHLETKSASPALTMAHTRPNVATPYVAPRTDLEQSIAEVWQSLLGIAEVGIHDNFLELGGHSLMAIQLASRIRDTFEIDLPVARFYKNPTVAGLAEAVVQVLAAQADSETIEQALREVQELAASS
jgi:acyl carrier protein